MVPSYATEHETSKSVFLAECGEDGVVLAVDEELNSMDGQRANVSSFMIQKLVTPDVLQCLVTIAAGQPSFKSCGHGAVSFEWSVAAGQVTASWIRTGADDYCRDAALLLLYLEICIRPLTTLQPRACRNEPRVAT